MDMTMLMGLNAKERELGEWIELFRQADPRFKFLGAEQPAGSALHNIELTWEG